MSLFEPLLVRADGSQQAIRRSAGSRGPCLRVPLQPRAAPARSRDREFDLRPPDGRSGV